MALIHDLLRIDGAVVYYVFRGQFASGAKVAWGTRAVRHDSGLIDDRLAMPADISEGLPNALGAAPERAMTTLTLHNADRAVDRYMVGGPSATAEYTGDSWLNLSGKVYLGVVADMQIAEQAISPTLCLNGSPSQQGGTVQIPMATRDELHFGKSKLVVTGKMIREAFAVDDGWRVETDIRGAWTGETFARGDWSEIVGLATENQEAVIPFAYGVSAIPLTRVTAKGRATNLFLGWLSISEPDISDAFTGWRLCGETYDEAFAGRGIFVFKIQLDIDLGAEVGRRNLWLVGMTAASWRETFDNATHILPTARALVGLAPGRRLNPANLMRQLIVDHSELGPLAVDDAAFARAAASFDVAGFGGVYRGDAAVSDLVQHISQVGYSLWVDTDDRVQILSHGAWSAEEATLAKAGPLIHVRPSSVAGGKWREYLPTGESERGAVASRVTIEWSGDQENFYPAWLRQKRAPGLHFVELAQESEARISGAWVYPLQTDDALSGAGSRRAFGTRRFVATGIAPETRLIPLGSLVRISHPLGSAPGGYEFRLGRLERRRVIPGEHGVELQVEDLGPIEHLRPGKLDDIANWIAHDPAGTGAKLELLTSGAAKATTAIFDSSMVGGSLWVFGASADDNRRSYRIDSIISPTSVGISPPPVSGEFVTASPGGTEPIDAAWIVMHSHESKGPVYRPEYIRVAGPDGLLPGGDPGYAMLD